MLCIYLTLNAMNLLTTIFPNTKYSMIYISYLGIFDGKNYEDANTPNQIGTALNAGYTCMVNVWRSDNKLYVGTENNQIEVSEVSLQGPRYIINAMNSEMQTWLPTQYYELYPNYFWFPNILENTPVTTSGGQLITPGSVAINNTSIIFLPENTDRGLLSTVKLRCYGVISTYLSFIRRMRNEGVWY